MKVFFDSSRVKILLMTMNILTSSHLNKRSALTSSHLNPSIHTSALVNQLFSCTDLLEFLFGSGLDVISEGCNLIGMILKSHLSIGFLDLIVGGIRRKSEQLVCFFEGVSTKIEHLIDVLFLNSEVCSYLFEFGYLC